MEKVGVRTGWVHRKYSAKDIIFLFYLITVTTFTRGSGFDSIISRAMFAIFTAYLAIIVVHDNRGKLFFNFQSVFYVLFWVYYFISILWGDTTDGLLYIQRMIQSIIVAFYLANNVHSVDDVNKCFKSVYVAILVFAVRLIIVTPASMWGNTRIGEELNINSTQVGMMSTFGVLLAVFFAENNKLHYITAVLFSLIALFSGTRTSILMIAIGIVVFFLLKEKGSKKIKWLLVSIALIAILFYLIMNVPIFYSIVGYRIDKILYSLFGVTYGAGVSAFNMYDHSAIERQFYRDNAMEMFRNKPIFGYGANGFYTQMKRIGYSHTSYSHNNYTELLSTLGIIGFLIYYLLHLRSLVCSARIHKKTRDPMALLVITIIVSCFVGDMYTVSYVSVITQIILCVCGNYSNFHIDEIEQYDDQ